MLCNNELQRMCHAFKTRIYLVEAAGVPTET